MGLALIMVYFKQTLIVIILLLIQTLGEFEVGWGMYRWIDSHHSLFEPLEKNKIVLSHPVYEGLSFEIETDTLITQ
jgi:hypothetical protein